ncbi:hypothetical protein RUM43_006030 [Polyplax serrata]|uniref:Uncharacterized protein n=1 Tax=Polyplax serrata TaxID=468196 RepID=A0AAN8PY73_POLSC
MYGFRDRKERELKVLENLELHIPGKGYVEYELKRFKYITTSTTGVLLIKVQKYVMGKSITSRPIGRQINRVDDSHGHLILFRVRLTVRDVDTGQAGEHWAAVKICTPGIVKV